jgi:hypothetical protein
MGTGINALAGLVGGVGGGQLLSGILGSGMDVGALAGNFVGGGVMGMIVQVVVGMLMKKFRA